MTISPTGVGLVGGDHARPHVYKSKALSQQNTLESHSRDLRKSRKDIRRKGTDEQLKTGRHQRLFGRAEAVTTVGEGPHTPTVLFPSRSVNMRGLGCGVLG